MTDVVRLGQNLCVGRHEIALLDKGRSKCEGRWNAPGQVDDLSRAEFAPAKPVRPGPKPRLSDGEVLTLVVLAQWQRGRSERERFPCRSQQSPCLPGSTSSRRSSISTPRR